MQNYDNYGGGILFIKKLRLYLIISKLPLNDQKV